MTIPLWGDLSRKIWIRFSRSLRYSHRKTVDLKICGRDFAIVCSIFFMSYYLKTGNIFRKNGDTRSTVPGSAENDPCAHHTISTMLCQHQKQKKTFKTIIFVENMSYLIQKLDLGDSILHISIMIVPTVPAAALCVLYHHQGQKWRRDSIESSFF